MPRHPPIALKTLDRSHCRCPSAQSEGLTPKPDPVRDRCSMVSAQKDQLLEIGPGVRLGKPIMHGRLSVSPRQTQAFSMQSAIRSKPFGDCTPARESEQIFSLRCQTEQAASRSSLQTLLANDHFPSQHQVMVEPDGIEPTTSCLQSRRSPS